MSLPWRNDRLWLERRHESASRSSRLLDDDFPDGVRLLGGNRYSNDVQVLNGSGRQSDESLLERSRHERRDFRDTSHDRISVKC